MNNNEPLDRAIVRAVRGEPSPWPLDRAHATKGTFEDRFNAGDKQILLWAIWDCAERRSPSEVGDRGTPHSPNARRKV